MGGGDWPPGNGGSSCIVCNDPAVLDDLGLSSLDQLPVLDDPSSHANVLEAMAAAQSTGVQEGGGSDLTPLEAAADVPAAQAAGAGGALGGDLFEMAEDTLRNDQVDASDGVTGTPHE